MVFVDSPQLGKRLGLGRGVASGWRANGARDWTMGPLQAHLCRWRCHSRRNLAGRLRREVDRVFVVESAKDGLGADCSCGNRAQRWQPMRADRGLHVEATVGAPILVSDLFAQDAFGVTLVADVGDGGNRESVPTFQAWAGFASLQNDQLLTKQGVLGDQAGARAERVSERTKNRARHFEKHPARVAPRARRDGDQGAWSREHRSSVDRALTWELLPDILKVIV